MRDRARDEDGRSGGGRGGSRGRGGEIENRRKKGWRRAGARYLRVGDKSARLNRGVKGGERDGRARDAGEGAKGARRTDGWTDAGQISRGCG